MTRPAIDPDDLAFMVAAGTDLDDLAQRVGVQPASLVRLAQRHGVSLPAGWVARAAEARRRANRDSMRRKRAGMPTLARGSAVKRPADSCPYCPTSRAALPAEQLLWAMRNGPHCGRHECVRAHERVRYARRKAAA